MSTMKTSPPLEAYDLAKTYRRRTWTGSRHFIQGLQGVDLRIQRGEAYGLVGPNGSGKSTTLKLALGLIRPTRGRIRINGYPGGDARGLAGLGYLPENPSLVPHLTPRELVVGAARVRGLPRQKARADADRLLEELGLSDAARQPIQQHSKGMAQRAALSFALAGNPRFLILDEPLTGLDPLWRHRVTELLTDFRQGGGTILFSSHILSDVERVADRIGIFHQGRLLREARPVELLSERMSGYAIRFRGELPPEKLDPTPEGSGVWRSKVGVAELWLTLETLREAGMELLAVEPLGAGLEDAFLATTGEEPEPHALP